MRLIHTVKRKAAQPAFVTLTFPDEVIPSPREAKVFLDTLFKRWKRRSPALSGIWRLEAHPDRSRRLEKPVPHFHLLVWGAWIDRFELSRDWSEIVCSESAQAVFWKHLGAGTKVESIRSWRGVCNYAAEYIGKDEEESLGENAGRIWGVFNRDALPVAKAECIKLSTPQVIRAVRWIKRFLRSRGVKWEYLPTSIYLECPADLLRALQL